ncbi:MAG TPA: hypothetical protein VG759_17305 [Candidatus Angelobacter sp.]|jgi:hypothetical protein|nr:hypothetical protein [Candidatus Angelobacter sp.]
MASPSTEWTKVLIHPLGLVGYVLFLLFGLIARAKRRDEKRWLYPAVLAAAGIALVGALGLAYLEVNHKAHEAVIVIPASTPTPIVVQRSIGQAPLKPRDTSPLEIKGDNNQVFKDIQSNGDMTITVGERSAETQTRKSPHKKP